MAFKRWPGWRGEGEFPGECPCPYENPEPALLLELPLLGRVMETLARVEHGGGCAGLSVISAWPPLGRVLNMDDCAARAETERGER